MNQIEVKLIQPLQSSIIWLHTLSHGDYLEEAQYLFRYLSCNAHLRNNKSHFNVPFWCNDASHQLKSLADVCSVFVSNVVRTCMRQTDCSPTGIITAVASSLRWEKPCSGHREEEENLDLKFSPDSGLQIWYRTYSITLHACASYDQKIPPPLFKATSNGYC